MIPEILILAAGRGTRMKSDLPKVLHKLGSKPLLEHVLNTAEQFVGANITVIYGHGGDLLREQFADRDIRWVLQNEQKGTGHAVAQAIPHIHPDRPILILYGDVPLIQFDTLKRLVSAVSDEQMGILTVTLNDPTGYGRIVRNDQGQIEAIVEQKDASETQKAIREINTGVMAVKGRALVDWVKRLGNENAAKEYYLTDIVQMASAESVTITASQPTQAWEVSGVNSQKQLADLERVYQRHRAETFAEAGVCFADLNRVDFRGEITIGQNVRIDINTIFEGEVQLGNDVVIESSCVLRNAVIGDGVVIRSHSLIDGAKIAAHASVGPFARLRPGTELAEKSRVGNFVEVKNAKIGKGSKVNHLSYIGDATLGEEVNIGAGTITCNYDGVNKHHTNIEDGAFIGSNSALVAPVVIGKGATIGAGSTITKEAPSGKLTIGRGKQKTIEGWQRPQRKE